MGLFGNRDPYFGDRLRAALATLGGDPQAIARMQAQMGRQREAEESRDASGRRQEALGGLGFSKDYISALNPADASQLARDRASPYSQAPGTLRVTPSLSGAEDTRFTAPIQEEQLGNWLDTQDPTGNLRQTYARRQAFPPTAIPEGGGMVGMGAQGPEWLVPPASVGAPAPSGPPASAPRTGPSAALGDPVRELTQIVGVAPSSGFRTQGHQDALVAQGRTRTRTGAHQRRDGIDFPIPRGPAQEAAAARIQQRYPQARFAREATNLHVSLPGWGGAPDISNSAGRYPERGVRSAPRLPAQTAQANGRTYYRVNGRWYDNPEGR